MDPLMLRLTRLAYTERGTLGLLEGPDWHFWTIEQPWRENRPFHSCVPLGLYDLVPHSSTKYPDVWAMVGGTVSHEPSPDHERYACLLHIANTMDDVSGCIGVGLFPDMLHGLLAVMKSGPAIKRLGEKLGHEQTHRLAIRQNGVAF